MIRRWVALFLAFFSIPAYAVGPSGSDSRIVLLWHSEECDGTTVRDYSGRDHTGAFSGGTAFVTTPFGNCGTYHDGSTDYINTPTTNDYNFTGTTPFSIFVWLKPETVSLAQQVFLKNFTSQTNETIGYAMQIGSPGQLSVIFKGGGGEAFGYNNSITSTTWQRVGFTWDGTTIKVYNNGNLVATGTGSGPNTTGADSLIRFGSRTHTTHQDYNGYADELTIYNKALTPTEVITVDLDSFGPILTVSDDDN